MFCLFHKFEIKNIIKNKVNRARFDWDTSLQIPGSEYSDTRYYVKYECSKCKKIKYKTFYVLETHDKDLIAEFEMFLQKGKEEN
jgi:hypothetical protein